MDTDVIRTIQDTLVEKKQNLGSTLFRGPLQLLPRRGDQLTVAFGWGIVLDHGARPHGQGSRLGRYRRCGYPVQNDGDLGR